MALKKEYEDTYKMFIIMGVCVLAINIYYYAYPLWRSMGITHDIIVSLFLRFREMGIFSSPYKTKLFALLLGAATVLTRHGKGRKVEWSSIIVTGITGIILYFLPIDEPIAYIFTSISGYLLIILSIALCVFKFSKFEEMVSDNNETFEQCEVLLENEDSVNLPTKFQYQNKIHNGWINFSNPFAGIMVTGVPGTGKSYSVFVPMMEQMIKKAYTMFVYDFKYPVLTYDVYNLLLQNQDAYIKRGVKIPKFYTVNFNDPRYSHRCNPLSRKYLKKMTDCTEIAAVLMDNLAKVDKEDFFSQSARLYTDNCISFLWYYKDGKYCSFPHLIQLMSQPAEVVVDILQRYDILKTKIASFEEALSKNANEQLAGQVASATVPIAQMAIPELYWPLSADDFSLDVSNPDEPKIVTVGNDPDNKNIYGAALALFFSRLFKILNHPGNEKCAVMLDEAPTVKIKNIDDVIATARSNRVAMVVGGQDFSQFVRDYQKNNAEVIFNTVGNIISGRVNRGTAEDLSKMFGKRFRQHRGQTLSDDNESTNISYSLDEIMPRDKIETLSTGTFIGKVADTHELKNDHKLFCGDVIIDSEKVKERKRNSKDIPQFTYFNENEIKAAIMHDSISYEDCQKLNIPVGIHEVAKIKCGFAALQCEGRVSDDTNEALKAFNKYPQSIREQMLEQFAEGYIQDHIQDVLMENFRKIQQDVEEILKEHGVDKESRDKKRKEDAERQDEEARQQQNSQNNRPSYKPEKPKEVKSNGNGMPVEPITEDGVSEY